LSYSGAKEEIYLKTILITGAKGFIGRNLATRLRHSQDIRLLEYDLGNSEAELRDALNSADTVFHLAGINRPQDVREFQSGNADFTGACCRTLIELGRKPQIIMTSSIQAAQENPYGASKRQAEEILKQYSTDTGAPVSIFRLKNVFGKWCRPNYNSVVATFCNNIAHDLPIQVNDPSRSLDLVYVDDVVKAFIREMDHATLPGSRMVDEGGIPAYTISLGDLAGRIQCFRDMQQSLRVPDFSIRFNQQLNATFLSYVPQERWEYGLQIRSDARGNLAEFIKSSAFGQIFVSRTKPGITRGNHYHHTKTEKFLVLEGEGLIRFRQIEGSEIVEHRVHGEDYRVVDIPPGYTHSITNVGTVEMVTLFWASEIFDPDRPDTYFLNVDPPAKS
jgi:UDP-2-acetamido-2,6-beta-L-arabino-hexul-4-ose reductase